MNPKARLLVMAAIWLCLGTYAWYLSVKHAGGRVYFAMIVVGIGMAAANVMRAVFHK